MGAPTLYKRIPSSHLLETGQEDWLHLPPEIIKHYLQGSCWNKAFMFTQTITTLNFSCPPHWLISVCYQIEECTFQPVIKHQLPYRIS
jgi:hypothetical protein